MLIDCLQPFYRYLVLSFNISKYVRRLHKRPKPNLSLIDTISKKVEKGFKKECIQTHIPLKNRGAAVISYLYEAVWLRYIITVFVSSKVILRIPWWTQGEQCVF